MVVHYLACRVPPAICTLAQEEGCIRAPVEATAACRRIPEVCTRLATLAAAYIPARASSRLARCSRPPAARTRRPRRRTVVRLNGRPNRRRRRQVRTAYPPQRRSFTPVAQGPPVVRSSPPARFTRTPPAVAVAAAAAIRAFRRFHQFNRPHLTVHTVVCTVTRMARCITTWARRCLSTAPPIRPRRAATSSTRGPRTAGDWRPPAAVAISCPPHRLCKSTVTKH